jgi:hypothetical protein
LVGAHLDHLGSKDGRIFPGADDNASGVAALIEIAKAFASAKEKPKRTIIFALWTGEEEGKLGSGYYVRHASWPLARTVAYLNVDMIGHPWKMEEIRKLVSNSRLPRGEEYLSKVNPENFVEPGLPRNASALEELLVSRERSGIATNEKRYPSRSQVLHRASPRPALVEVRADDHAPVAEGVDVLVAVHRAPDREAGVRVER